MTTVEPIHTEVVVLGAGPGGYAAAFYAADLGKQVLLVEQEKSLGGVCLNRGCIPSKALLYAAKLIVEARESAQRGITFGAPQIELDKLRAWKSTSPTWPEEFWDSSPRTTPLRFWSSDVCARAGAVTPASNAAMSTDFSMPVPYPPVGTALACFISAAERIFA